MKQPFYILTIILTLCFVGCDNEIDNSDDAVMKRYYYESCEYLDGFIKGQYIYDDIEGFGDEYVEFTTSKPELKSNEFYNPTCKNLKEMGYDIPVGFTLYGDDEWKGEIDF